MAVEPSFSSSEKTSSDGIIVFSTAKNPVLLFSMLSVTFFTAWAVLPNAFTTPIPCTYSNMSLCSRSFNSVSFVVTVSAFFWNTVLNAIAAASVMPIIPAVIIS